MSGPRNFRRTQLAPSGPAIAAIHSCPVHVRLFPQKSDQNCRALEYATQRRIYSFNQATATNCARRSQIITSFKINRLWAQSGLTTTQTKVNNSSKTSLTFRNERSIALHLLHVTEKAIFQKQLAENNYTCNCSSSRTGTAPYIPISEFKKMFTQKNTPQPTNEHELYPNVPRT